MITLNDTDLEDLLFCSFRYALGRRTYITGVVASLLIKYTQNVPSEFKKLVCREIEDAIDRNEAGMDMDIYEWKKVVEVYSAVS